VKARVHAEPARLLLELPGEGADAVDLQPHRRLRQRGGLEQDVDALPVLEVRGHTGDQHVVRGPGHPVPELDPVRDHVQEPRWEAVREHEVGHRLRGRDDVAEPRQARLDRQVAVLEPRDPSARDARRVGRVRAADARCDLLGHPVQRMEHAGAAHPSGQAAEQPCATVVRVHQIGVVETSPELAAAAHVELVRHGDGLG
jgi:hypothetical protein